MTTPISADRAAPTGALANRPATEEASDAELGSSRTALASDFNTFLKLLTTQMQYQDPLKPIESTEFVAQLAQFSSVEQQIATNTSLTSILEAVTASSAGSLADWLGREVAAEVPIAYTGQPVEVRVPEASINPTSATLLVLGPDGELVAEQSMGRDDTVVTWNGKTADGLPVPHGTYSFAVRFGGEKGLTETHDATVFARVTEARREGGDVMLMLEGGGSVLSNNVQAARNPTPAPGTAAPG